MELEFSGERVVPGIAITYGVIEHLHRYAVAREFCGACVGHWFGHCAALLVKLTMVVAAHRLSTVTGCDQLIDLRNG
jgi:hypothetical protein